MTGLGVVVVTYESAAVLSPLLEDLRTVEPDARVVVVDNASPSGPPPVPGPAELLRLPDNRGYGAACNAGARHLEGVSHIAFLNPDVRLRGPSLSQLAAGLATRRKAGVATGPVVGPRGERVPSAWAPTSPARAIWFASGWRLPRTRAAVGRILRGRGVMASAASMTDQEMTVSGHVLGGAMVVDAGCFEQVGGFDERFFMFWEDADLCLRAQQAGWTVHLLPCEPIQHVEGTSSAGVTTGQRWRWYVEGADLFARKHLSAPRRLALHAALSAGRALRPLARSGGG